MLLANMVTWFFVIVGIAIRLVVYLHNRSIFIDAANLVRNIYEKSYFDLFGNLSYEQYAPPLFLVIVKWCSQVFGFSEYSLRLLPLIAGVVSIFLLLYLVKKTIRYQWQWLPMALFALSFELVTYSSTIKQYSSDVCCTLLLLAACLYIKPQQLTSKTIGIWLVLGSIAVWFSMPAVFVLSGVGFYYLLALLNSKSYRLLLTWIACGGVWLLNFAILYFTVLNKDIGSEYLEQFHARYFFPFIPSNMEECSIQLNILKNIFRTIAGATALGISLASIGSILGVCTLINNKQKYQYLWLLLVPFLLCLFASSLHYYSAITRLMLFILPCLILLVALGYDFFSNKNNSIFILSSLAWFIVIAGLPIKKYFFTPYYDEELRQVLLEVNTLTTPNSNICMFVDHEAQPAFYYYTHIHPLKSSWVFDTPTTYPKWNDTPAMFINKLSNKTDTFLLLISHKRPKQVNELLGQANQIGKRVEKISHKGASAHWYVLE